eukprot:CAMPEP_0119272346 /NCGR_PEP_ID=MMETSP1329-20130426/8564_1 /TAXON_ID=114041 /ORGANISM="Genus nov. species nov., Strain RCC1024" /LENGTH=79 /DNA_ID=CAMNT_0007272409 /DNA_START=133 /DNA_END=369 /DNA_ORIENTATION=-
MSLERLTLVPDETARRYLERCFAAPRTLGVPQLGAAGKGEVIELYGTSQTGKSELLLHMCAAWALPEDHGGGARRVAIL